jgi:hypothetical protein
LPEQLYQHTVVGCFGDGQVKLHIAAFGAARRAAGQCSRSFQLQGLAHFRDIFPGRLQGGKFGDITFLA